MIANHGQIKEVPSMILVCNSRLDALQASILNIKLKYLDTYNLNRSKAAQIYTNGLSEIKDLENSNIEETFYNYTYFTIHLKDQE